MRVPRTFAFVDLSGFTNYTAAFGDDAAGRILSAFRTITREIASERGVRIAKWLGDGCMIVSVDQTACIAFALELEYRASEVCAPLSLRVGIATGLLVGALHQAGLATLTHTPSPMGFLGELLQRPKHEMPFLLLVAPT